MTAYIIDTAAAIKRLVSAGLDQTLAEVIVETFAEAQSDVASKTDIRMLKTDIEMLKNWMLVRLVMTQLGTVAILYALIRLFGVG